MKTLSSNQCSSANFSKYSWFCFTETGRAVRSTARGTGGDLRTERDAIVLASRSSRFDASYGRFDAQFALLCERGLTCKLVEHQIGSFRVTKSFGSGRFQLPAARSDSRTLQRTNELLRSSRKQEPKRKSSFERVIAKRTDRHLRPIETRCVVVR